MPDQGTFEPLRIPASHVLVTTPVVVSKPSGGGYLADVTGDALEVLADFDVSSGSTAAQFGLRLRLTGGR